MLKSFCRIGITQNPKHFQLITMTKLEFTCNIATEEMTLNGIQNEGIGHQKQYTNQTAKFRYGKNPRISRTPIVRHRKSEKKF